MKAEEILETALRVIKEREQQHGNKSAVLSSIAALWGGYLGLPIKPIEVASMMVLLKIARSQHGQFNPDDFIDACGYAALAAETEEWK